MPSIYRAICAECGHSPTSFGDVAGCVIMDGGDGGAIIPEGYIVFRRQDGEEVCLSHPIETSILEASGGSWRTSSRAGKLIDVQPVVCNQCGFLHERRTVHSQHGCGLALVLGSVSFGIAQCAIGLKFPAAWIGAFGALFATLVCVDALNRIRWREANEAMRLKVCDRCGGSAFSTLREAEMGPMMCPRCRERAMKYSLAGMA